MLKLFGGAYPPGHDATSFGNFAAHADAKIDTEALPAALSASGTNEVAFANRYAVRLVLHSMWLSAGGPLSGAPEPELWTEEWTHELKQLLGSSTADGWTTLDWIDETGW